MRLVAGMMERPDRLLTTIIIGNMIVNVLAAAIFGVTIERAFLAVGASELGAFALAAIIMTTLILMFGEIVPKVFALRNPERTAGYYFTARGARRGLSLEEVVEVAHARGSYVVVDAAAENPPKMKLRYYVERGADLVAYSGGKHIRGPNNSGLLAGRADLIRLAHLQSYPFSGVGRGSKMSRETIVGLVKALEIYLASDEEAEFAEWLHHVEYFVEELGSIPGVEAGITYQRIVETGEPMAPFCYLRLDEGICGMSGRELVSRLQEGDPKIHTLWEPRFLLGPDCEGMMAINPEYMLEGEHEVVVEAIKEILGV